VFRAIDRWEAIDDRALTPQAINLILKRRCAMAGLDPVEFSAHGLRSGYLTEAARVGVALPAAMRQSQHRSVQQAGALLQRGRSGARKSGTAGDLRRHPFAAWQQRPRPAGRRTLRLEPPLLPTILWRGSG
jgi:integrase